MKSNYLLCIALVLGSLVQAQDYLDIVRVNISRTNLENLDQTFDTDVNNVNIEFLYPTPITDKIVLITGFTAENTNLGLRAGIASENLTMTRLNLGAKISHNRKWTGTYVLTPKLASNFESIGGRDFQFGGLALLEYRFKSSLRGKFGMYSSTENFGTIITPLIGGYYESKNNKFQVDATLPIRMEANYNIAGDLSLGVDLRTSIKSYHMGEINNTESYVQEESIRFGLTASYAMLDKTLILRGKVGLDTTDYGLYEVGDTVGAQILTLQVSKDERNRLNGEFDTALFVGLDLIYRLGL
jgi:hypothetical protein